MLGQTIIDEVIEIGASDPTCTGNKTSLEGRCDSIPLTDAFKFFT